MAQEDRHRRRGRRRRCRRNNGSGAARPPGIATGPSARALARWPSKRPRPHVEWLGPRRGAGRGRGTHRAPSAQLPRRKSGQRALQRCTQAPGLPLNPKPSHRLPSLRPAPALLLTARGPDSDLSGHSSPSSARSELSQRLKPATSASSAASLSDVPRPGREIERGAFWRKEKDSSRCCPAQRPSQPTTSQ